MVQVENAGPREPQTNEQYQRIAGVTQKTVYEKVIRAFDSFWGHPLLRLLLSLIILSTQ